MFNSIPVKINEAECFCYDGKTEAGSYQPPEARWSVIRKHAAQPVGDTRKSGAV